MATVESPDEQSGVIDVSLLDDVDHARRVVVEAARRFGMAPERVDEIAIVTTELASNIVRYAGGGRLRFRRRVTEDRPALEIEADDAGPGIPDIEAAMRDGYSTGGSLGSGLPAIRRLVDSFEIASSPAGTRIRVSKWLTTSRRP